MDSETWETGQCDVCGQIRPVTVVAVPGVPVSAAYCTKCFDADAHPMKYVIDNTVVCGGRTYTAEWWQELIKHTCDYLGVSLEDFDKWVAVEIEKDQKGLELLSKKLQGPY